MDEYWKIYFDITLSVIIFVLIYKNTTCDNFRKILPIKESMEKTNKNFFKDH